MGQPRGPSGAFIRYARYLADLQAMPQGGVCSLETKRHPRPARLLSARFGKAGARAAMARSLSPRSTKGETSASPPYGSFSAFSGLRLRHERVNTLMSAHPRNVLYSEHNTYDIAENRQAPYKTSSIIR